MDKFKRFFVMFILFSVSSGCSTAPVHEGIAKAGLTKLIVRDITWKETATSDLHGEQLQEFIASQPRLNELFQRVFDTYIKERGVFESISYGNANPDSATLVMVPKIYTLKPDGFMPGATFTGFLLSPDGSLLGTYTEERRLNRSGHDPERIKENIEKLLMELAEDAASRLPHDR